MKAGTAQKMILNMISTSVMIQLGRVKGNKMVNMQLSNQKLRERGMKMIQSTLGVSYEDAKVLLQKYGSVKKAIEGAGARSQESGSGGMVRKIAKQFSIASHLTPDS